MSTTTPMSKQTKKNSKATGQRFTQAETNTLLDLITELMPMGHEGWENLREQFNEAHPKPGREAEGLKKRFATLWKKKTLTGDPHCQPEVRRAKRLKMDLYESNDMSDMEGTGNDVDGTIREEEDDDDD